MNNSKILRAIISFLFLCVLSCQASQYWVRPDTAANCPESVSTEHCVTLSDIAANNFKYFSSNNTEIRFLAGVHSIASTQDTWIGVTSFIRYAIRKKPTYTHNVSLAGVNYVSALQRQAIIINCNGSKFGFAFYMVSNLSLSGITIINCGFNAIRHLGTFEYNRHEYAEPRVPVHTSLFIADVEDLTLHDVTITESTGFGLLALSPFGNIWIDNCVFKHNGIGLEYFKDSPGGNAHVELVSSITMTNLTITNSIIAHGFSSHSKPLFPWGCESFGTYCQIMSLSSGLDLYMDNIGKQYVLIRNCTFYNNTAPFGANLMLTSYSSSPIYGESIQNFKVDRCTFHNGKANRIGGGIYIQFTGKEYGSSSSALLSVFTVSNSTFGKNIAENLGGAIAVTTALSYTARVVDIVLKNNTFVENVATVGAALYHKIKSWESGWYHMSQTTQIDSCVFILNKASRDGGAIAFTHSKDINMLSTYAVYLKIKGSIFTGNTAELGSSLNLYFIQETKPGDYCRIELENCTFTQHFCTDSGFSTASVINLNTVQSLFLKYTSISDNMCRGIYSKWSSIEVGSQVYIANNTAKEGAGMYLDCYPTSTDSNVSCIVFTNSSSMYLRNNHALNYGGGILTMSGDTVPKICFFEVNKVSEKQSIFMHGNTAGISGTSIFGGNLENCYLGMTDTVLSPLLFWSTFNITEKDFEPSVVTSQPYKVCICNETFTNDHSCSFDYSIEVYPGEIFLVPAVGVGQYNNSSPSVIRATVANGYNAQLGDQQVTQDVKLLCKNLTYSLQTLEHSLAIQLSIETPYLLEMLPELQPATVTAVILDCPIGFELNKKPLTCDCLPHLASRGVTCNIQNQTVHRSRSMWIGNFSENIVVHQNCPFDYCDQNVLDFSLDNQEEQCNWNRTGILCGACPSELSLVLGTSQCKKCSNVHLLLVLPILLSGFGLVVLLLKCNLTVSTGTINGLIFYANIIQVNSKVFFPPGSIPLPGYILSIFIAWINLDLGIEVCFTENLDMLTRTWLQFLFPIYIWLIVGLLILVCRYSTTVSRLTGSNTVSVLATLFLLSYAKLLRTTLNAFSPVAVTDSNNTDHLRWLLDGNRGFLHWPHLALFLVGLLTLVTHLIPFTALVLLGPTLQAHTHYRVLGWVPRFKPFLDAYQGPYKTKYRYWTGLMLLVRVFLFSVFAGNALGDPNVNLLIISLTLLVVLIVWLKIGRVYRNSPLNGLELFYLLNLEVTVVATQYLRASSDNSTQQQILSLIMVGSALFICVCTLVYHCYSQLIKTNLIRKLKMKTLTVRSSRKSQANNLNIDEGENEPEVKVIQKSPTRTVVCLKELLLED